MSVCMYACVCATPTLINISCFIHLRQTCEQLVHNVGVVDRHVSLIRCFLLHSLDLLTFGGCLRSLPLLLLFLLSLNLSQTLL